MAEQFFLEWSQAYGYYYGTPAGVLERLTAGISLFLIVDLAGVQALRRLNLVDAIYIWITAPPADLAQRLAQRRTEAAVEIAKRLVLAQQEVVLISQQAPQLFDFILANDRELKSAIADLEQLIVHRLGLCPLPEANLSN